MGQIHCILLTAMTPKRLMKHAKLLKFLFGRCGGYKNTREGVQGGEGEKGGKEEKGLFSEICSWEMDVDLRGSNH